jgi:hypothetical protein
MHTDTVPIRAWFMWGGWITFIPIQTGLLMPD